MTPRSSPETLVTRHSSPITHHLIGNLNIRQRGLSLVGNLVMLAILAGAGYFLYKTIMETDTGPGCKDALTSCMKHCRRSTTDSTSAQACQDACQRDMDACARAAR